eukprot:maker-scaffold101_size371023-snap-gene-0.20 protein:Tk03056 transcript:maker-scaffold101_size371023-snap-gene-0.20-mRNA-1 annotation:"leucine-rich repeat-containing protein 48-like isoform x3"
MLTMTPTLDEGRTFRGNIESFLAQNAHVNNVLVEKYQSAKVRMIYEKLLKNTTETFPQYIDELKGIAHGARVPFFKLFLMHIDDIISGLCGKEPYGGMLGSTTIICDQENKLPEEKCPNVINNRIICEALSLDANEIRTGRSKQAFEIKTAQTLRIEFCRILKIENLQHLTSLTRLFLDNNFIEEISGLDELIHLTWLDLSFNCIRVIQGLRYLDKLEVLALYRNKIETIENIDHLKALKVLRLGRNHISDRKANIICLRQLPALKTLSVKENPFCLEPDWKEFVIALLPNLMYLECHNITQAQRDAALIQHQGEVFKVKNQEELTKSASDKDAEKMSVEQKHKAAFVSALRGQLLMSCIMRRNEEQETLLAELLGQCGHMEEFQTLEVKFRRQILDIGDHIYDIGLSELKTRDSEVKMFEKCVATARTMAQESSIQEIDAYMKDRDKIVDELYELAGVVENKEVEEISDMQREEAERIKERFSRSTKDLWGRIMSLEVILVNQTEKVLLEFEGAMTQNLSSFIQSIKELFRQARDADTRHYQRLGNLIASTEEEQFQKEDPIFADDHTLSKLIAICHDGHQEFLLEEDAKLQIAVQKWKDDFMIRFMKKERKRNRERILELNHFVVLGHSQDFSPDAINQGYIVNAHILEAEPRGKYGLAEEKFSAFCLPGMLPGLFMGYNYHGMVFTVNTISTGKFSMNRTPRHFLCRALMGCANMFDAMEVVQDEGQGISDGISVNMIFCQQEGAPLFHNAEVAPPINETSFESQLSVLTLSPGEHLTHCNKLKATQSDHLPLWSSNHRHAVLRLLPRVESVSNVVAILGDQTDVMFSFFRDGGGKDNARTIVVGIFNLGKLTWSIYTQNPKNAMPVVVLPITLK